MGNYAHLAVSTRVGDTMDFSLWSKLLHEMESPHIWVYSGSTTTFHHSGQNCSKGSRDHSPLLKRFLAHLSRSSLHLFRNGIFLSFRDLVHCVACIQPVRTSFATQTCSVSPPWEEARKIQVVTLIQTTKQVRSCSKQSHQMY